jgi:sporulation protein YlmC with PRC-barrel domain
MHLSELRGRRVVSRASAETLGEVTDLRLSTNPSAPSAIASLQVGKGRKAGSVAWAQIVGVGPDAVVVTDDDAASEQPDIVSPVGRLVLSELGNEAGAVTDVEFDETTGTLISLATDSVLIEGDRLLADGPYAIIVAAREGAEFPG